MALEVRKQNRETNQGLIRRFQKSIQGSGILLRARKIMFRDRQKSRKMKKMTALHRERLKDEYERLMKLGKIK